MYCLCAGGGAWLNGWAVDGKRHSPLVHSLIHHHSAPTPSLLSHTYSTHSLTHSLTHIRSTHSPTPPHPPHTHPQAPNGRLIDPRAFAHSSFAHNYTLAKADTDSFLSIRAAAHAARDRGVISPQQWSAWWARLSTGSERGGYRLSSLAGKKRVSSLAVQPLSAYQCAEPDNCIAVTQRNLTCICEKSKGK